MIAPTVDEAVARGAAELGVTPDRLLVEVLDEGGQGILGLGSRPARGRLTMLGGAPAARPAPSAAPAGDEDDFEDEDEQTEAPGAAVDREIEVARDTVRELVSRMGLAARVSGRWGEADEPEEPRPVLVDIRGENRKVTIVPRRSEDSGRL